MNYTLIGWLNCVLHHFQQYFSHITATAHIIHVCSGFHQYYARALKCVVQDTLTKNPGDRMLLEPRISELRVKHFTTKQSRAPELYQEQIIIWRWVHRIYFVDQWNEIHVCDSEVALNKHKFLPDKREWWNSKTISSRPNPMLWVLIRIVSSRRF